jgi:adenylate cyclase
VSGQRSALNRVLGELRRRHVFRLAGVYVVGSWLILQVADVLLDIIAAPDGSLRVIALVLVLFFPLAMIMAWIYDLTPEGIVKTGAPDESGEPAFRWNWRLVDFAIIAALVAILAFVLLRDGDDLLPADEHSIAVLPFADLSPEGDNRYFSDGLTEALMDSLARIPGLQVASRTSSFAFRDPGPGVREVASALEVATLLEGSVRKAGDQLKISARLVDGRNGRPLWRETFDASMEDVFLVQETISRGIAEALKIQLLGGEVLVAIPTQDQAAYEDYLRGRDQLRRDGTLDNLDEAIVYFRAALARDEHFSLAHAGLCTTFLEKYSVTRDGEFAAEAVAACERAEREQDSPTETLVALGGLYRATGQLEQSRAILLRALEADPNNAEAHAGLGDTLGVLGDFEGAALSHRRAIELDPAFWRYYWRLGVMLTRLGRFDEAIAQHNRASRLQPQSPVPYSSAGAAYFLQGEYLKAGDAFRESIRRSPSAPAYANAGTTYFYGGDYVQAEEMFQRALELSPADFRYRGFLADSITMQAGRDPADAASHFEVAIAHALYRLGINPRDHASRAALASYLAQVGRTDSARLELGILEREDSLEMEAYRNMGMAYLFLGQRNDAVRQFALAAEQGYPPALYLRDPRLDALADISKYQALVKDEQQR